MLKQFFMYPFNLVILAVGLILLVAAILYLIRSKNQNDGDDGD